MLASGFGYTVHRSNAANLLVTAVAPGDGFPARQGWERHVGIALTDEERRRTLGVVLQVVQLFRGTVLDNLTLGNGAVSREAIERAAAIAAAAAFIEALPQGYDTLLGSGIPLSAGERYAAALTRALVWDPAAVHSVSEAAVRAALRTAVMGSGRAVLTVAHRLAAAQDADQVLVMEAGWIVEAGRRVRAFRPAATARQP